MAEKEYSEQLTVRMEPWMKEYLERIAGKSDKDQADFVRYAIKLFKIITREELKFYDVVNMVIRRSEFEKRKQLSEILELLRKGEKDAAKEKIEQYSA